MFQISKSKMFHVSCSMFHVIFLFVLFSVYARVTYAAQVYLLPQTHTITEGETVIAELRLNTEGGNINAFDIIVSYPPDILRVAQVLYGGSLADVWVQNPAHSKIDGMLLFQGGRTDGFNGEGFIAKIIFEAKKSGVATITFTPTSQVLLADGRGTPVLGIFSAAQYNIERTDTPIISVTSSTHPEESTWYKEKDIFLEWKEDDDFAYSYVLSRDIIQNPDDIPERTGGVALYKNPDDGIYYFSIARLKDGTWSSPVRRKVLRDGTPPKQFEVLIGHDASVFENRYFATFSAQDNTSGIKRYEIREFRIQDLGLGKKVEWKTAESPYPLGDQTLRSIIKVKAIDAAGNERVATFVPPLITFVLNAIFILLLGSIIFAIKVLYGRTQKHET